MTRLAVSMSCPLVALAMVLLLSGCDNSDEEECGVTRTCDDATGTPDGNDANTGGSSADCWRWIDEATPSCPVGCETMFGDLSMPACGFAEERFSPTVPVFCHPVLDNAQLQLQCMEHAGRVIHLRGPSMMQDLPDWRSCGCI